MSVCPHYIVHSVMSSVYESVVYPVFRSSSSFVSELCSSSLSLVFPHSLSLALMSALPRPLCQARVSQSTAPYVSFFVLTVSCSLFSVFSFVCGVMFISAVFPMCFHSPRHLSVYLVSFLSFVVRSPAFHVSCSRYSCSSCPDFSMAVFRVFPCLILVYSV